MDNCLDQIMQTSELAPPLSIFGQIYCVFEEASPQTHSLSLSLSLSHTHAGKTSMLLEYGW